MDPPSSLTSFTSNNNLLSYFSTESTIITQLQIHLEFTKIKQKCLFYL